MEFNNTVLKIQASWASFLHQLPNTIIGILIICIFFLIGAFVRKLLLKTTTRTHFAKNLAIALGRLIQTACVILGILIAMVFFLPAFKPAYIVQLVGFAGVALGFIFRDILQNYLAGIILLINEPFRIGDQIAIDKYEGLVEEIQTRATYVRTYDGRRVVIPNYDLYINAVTVNTAFEKRRIEHDISIGYGDDIENTKALILSALEKVTSILFEPQPEVLVVELNPDSVKLRLRWWISPPFRSEANKSLSEILTVVKQTLLENGIDIPFNTYQILFHDQTESTDGQRELQREGWPATKEKEKIPEPRRIVDGLFHLGHKVGNVEKLLEKFLDQKKD